METSVASTALRQDAVERSLEATIVMLLELDAQVPGADGLLAQSRAAAAVVEDPCAEPSDDPDDDDADAAATESVYVPVEGDCGGPPIRFDVWFEDSPPLGTLGLRIALVRDAARRSKHVVVQDVKESCVHFGSLKRLDEMVFVQGEPVGVVDNEYDFEDLLARAKPRIKSTPRPLRLSFDRCGERYLQADNVPDALVE
ncbi:hypothetical protein M885DRAFT_620664 [Pelagophyceae sp. CCMP2097]|nr:hypothetical protein M885DRAFT_620664 [Pelagophyceae sp. CCMP2097]